MITKLNEFRRLNENASDMAQIKTILDAAEFHEVWSFANELFKDDDKWLSENESFNDQFEIIENWILPKFAADNMRYDQFMPMWAEFK